ncbi:hypothetical protein KJ765_01155 [Candidatus Micrarchaeota archaeon]|nr:hypothetical protein [Candidatus Micrarchaeota archaeon]
MSTSKRFKHVTWAILAFIALIIASIGASYHAVIDVFGAKIALQPYSYVFWGLAFLIIVFIAFNVWKPEPTHAKEE